MHTHTNQRTTQLQPEERSPTTPIPPPASQGKIGAHHQPWTLSTMLPGMLISATHSPHSPWLQLRSLCFITQNSRMIALVRVALWPTHTRTHILHRTPNMIHKIENLHSTLKSFRKHGVFLLIYLLCCGDVLPAKTQHSTAVSSAWRMAKSVVGFWLARQIGFMCCMP